MAERRRAPLTELREVEERLAVRTARIDQLQAAVESSQVRSLRFGRGLVVVGSLAALASALLPLRQANEWTLNIGLAVAAGLLTLATILFSVGVRQFATGRHPRMAFEPLFLWWVRRSLWWPTSRLIETNGVPLALRSRPAQWLAATGLLGAAAVLWVGSVALAALALLLVLGLLRATWSRQVYAPGVVQILGPIIALAAVFSVGSSIGSVCAEFLRAPDASPPAMRADARELPAASAPTYEELCGAGGPWSGRATSPGLTQLREAWLTNGALVAGCPLPATKISAREGVVTVVGTVDGSLRSFGIADERRGTVLLGEAAGVALRLARDGSLRGVPLHLLVGGGDIYLLQSAAGTVVLARRAGSAPGGSSSTERDARTGERYVVMTPALAGLWVRAMAREGEWLWPMAARSESGSSAFDFLDQASQVGGYASCRLGDRSCELSMADGEPLRSRPGARVGADRILRYAPSP